MERRNAKTQSIFVQCRRQNDDIASLRLCVQIRIFYHDLELKLELVHVRKSMSRLCFILT